MHFSLYILCFLVGIGTGGLASAQYDRPEDSFLATPSPPRRAFPMLEIYNTVVLDDASRPYCSLNVSTERVFRGVHDVKNLHFSGFDLPPEEGDVPLNLSLRNLDLSEAPTLIVEFYLHDPRTQEIVFRFVFTYPHVEPHFSTLVLTLRSLTQMDTQLL